MKSCVLAISLILICTTGCSTSPKYKVLSGPGTQYAKWQKGVLEECSDRAALVTFDLVVQKSKEGYVFTQEDVINIHQYLIKKCSRNSGITI